MAKKVDPVSPGEEGVRLPPLPQPTYVSLKKRMLSTKTLITVGSLVAIFVLVGIGREVRQLEIIIPAILLFYNGSNVYQDVQNHKIAAQERKGEGHGSS